MTEVQKLINMARRGAEDGHDMEWHSMVTDSPRILSLMSKAHFDALKAMKEPLAQSINELPNTEYEFC